MSHTPGPWKVLCGDVVLECNEKEVVAWVGNIDGQMINNAHLIAAAPEMLEALENLVAINEAHNQAVEGVIGRPVEWKDGYLDEARAAIRKARGEE